MKARRVGALIKHHLPVIHRAIYPVWRLWRRFVPAPTYWGERRHLAYYRCVVDMVKLHVPAGGSVLDVGAADTRVIDALTWFERRVALDRRPIPPRAGIEPVVMDFMDYAAPVTFDLVMCLQVLEHLPDPGPFARKLLASGTTVVLSVPYRWPSGSSPGHCQDPVDEAKLAGWVGQPALDQRIAKNGRERLVAVYRPRPRATRS